MNFSASLPPLDVNGDEALTLDMEQSPQNSPVRSGAYAHVSSSVSAVGGPLSGRVSPTPTQTSSEAFNFASFAPSQSASVQLPSLSRQLTDQPTEQPTGPFQSASGILSASQLRPLSLSLSPVHSPVSSASISQTAQLQLPSFTRQTSGSFPSFGFGGGSSPRALTFSSASQAHSPMAQSASQVSQLPFPSFTRVHSGSFPSGSQSGPFSTFSHSLSLSLPQAQSQSQSQSASVSERDRDMAISPKARKEPEEHISNASPEYIQQGLQAFADAFGVLFERDDEDSDSESETDEDSDRDRDFDFGSMPTASQAPHSHSQASVSVSASMSGAQWTSGGSCDMSLSEGSYDHGRRGTKRKMPQRDSEMAGTKMDKPNGVSVSQGEPDWDYGFRRVDGQFAALSEAQLWDQTGIVIRDSE